MREHTYKDGILKINCNGQSIPCKYLLQQTVYVNLNDIYSPHEDGQTKQSK